MKIEIDRNDEKLIESVSLKILSVSNRSETRNRLGIKQVHIPAAM